MTRRACFQRYVLALLSCCCWVAGALAANLQISPVMINFRADQVASGITLQNLAATPIYGQVRVFLWQQRDGEDVLAPTQDVLASPPIVQIGAGASQTVRLVRSAAQPGAAEGSYRVLIDELAGEGEGAATGVDIRLRYSVPLFIAAGGPAAQENLAWRFFRQDGDWMLAVQNSGRARAQIGAMSVTNRAGKEFVVSTGLFGYVLAGNSRQWRLPLAKDAELGGTLAIKARINGKALTANYAGNE